MSTDTMAAMLLWIAAAAVAWVALCILVARTKTGRALRSWDKHEREILEREADHKYYHQ